MMPNSSGTTLKKMYSLVAVIILSMIAGVLFLTDSMWSAQSRAHDSFRKLQHLEGLATNVKAEITKPTRISVIVDRALYRNSIVAFSDAITQFNVALDEKSWITNLLKNDKAQEMRIRRFQSQSLQMVQSVSLIMQAEKARDITNSKRKLAIQFHDRFFQDGRAILETKQLQIDTLNGRLNIFTALILPILATILFAIWKFMISPMIIAQRKAYQELKKSKEAAIELADVAIQANVAKTHFLTVLSHELRTPLNGVIGLSETLAAQLTQTSEKSNAQEIVLKGKELAILVNEAINLTDQDAKAEFDPDLFMKAVQKKQQKLTAVRSKAPDFKVPTDCRVLIADDNRTNRMVMGKLVKRMGASADIVEDGEEAIQAFKSNIYDLLLLDIAMPNKTGEEAIQAIRAYEKSENLKRSKALAVTANTLKDQLESYYNSGFDDCLAKPVNFARLSDKINGLLTV
jgi:CheY-like chemotaxis protein